MRKFIRTALSLLMVATMCFAVSGCGGSNGGKGGSKDKKVSIYYWGELSEREQEFVDFAKKEYGVTVDPIITSWDGWEAKLLTDYSAGNAPDVIQIFEKVFPRIAIQNILCSVEDLEKAGVKGLDDKIIADNSEASRKVYTYKDKVYSVADAASSPVFVFVNETLYTEKGVKSPSAYYEEGNWNWDTMITCAKAITEDSNNDGETDIWGYGAWDLSYITRSNGVQFISIEEDGTLKTNIDSPAMKKGLEMVDRLYHVDKVAPIDSNSWLGYFRNEKTGMLAATPDNVVDVLTKAEFEWSMIPYPAGPDNTEGYVPGSIWGYSVVSSSKNKQAAVDYIKARLEFDSKNPDPRYDSFSDDQKQMIKDASSKILMPFYHGVGDLWNLQWDFWWKVKGGTDASQLIAEYQPVFEGQAQITMDEQPIEAGK